MPNILRKFNPSLVGVSVGNDFVLTTKQGQGLNVAVSGQEANHLPEQARLLVNRLKEHSSIDYQNDWKLITVFIGGK
jgi:phospholipase B1, membrane-associated